MSFFEVLSFRLLRFFSVSSERKKLQKSGKFSIFAPHFLKQTQVKHKRINNGKNEKIITVVLDAGIVRFHNAAGSKS